MSLILLKYFFAEVLFKILSDYEYYLAESSLYGIVDGIVHDGLAVGSESVELFQTAVTASHTGS